MGVSNQFRLTKVVDFIPFGTHSNLFQMDVSDLFSPPFFWVSGGCKKNLSKIWIFHGSKVVLVERGKHSLLNQTIQIIQKGDFWGKNRRFLAF
jgi:hypothetical protein